MVTFAFQTEKPIVMKHFFNTERPVKGLVPTIDFQTATVFQPLPKPSGPQPFHLDIKTIISAGAYDHINTSKIMAYGKRTAVKRMTGVMAQQFYFTTGNIKL